MKIYNCTACGSTTSKIASEKHLVEDIDMDLYYCEKCGKIEFYKSNFKEKQINYIECENCGNMIDDSEKLCPYCDEVVSGEVKNG